ncbi:hypothetical protein [Corallococcus exercitus]|uniref:hypothetical protein n=1 Tax=Corallococcus exercitus TaxID=2316736 RepID=UPI0011C37F75|nr:hypothetical protein [Corallococcus exercitus]
MSGMKMGLLALVSGLLLACGGTLEAESPELSHQAAGLCGSCGDSVCDPSTENRFNCPQDCAGSTCGDRSCCDGETPDSCPQDCPFASNFCYLTPDWFSAPVSARLCAVCGDSICDASSENSSNCPQDCGAASSCGDSICDPNTETRFNCPQDCGSTCGDHSCCDGETPDSCPQDCPFASNFCYFTPEY